MNLVELCCSARACILYCMRLYMQILEVVWVLYAFFCDSRAGMEGEFIALLVNEGPMKTSLIL